MGVWFIGGCRKGRPAEARRNIWRSSSDCRGHHYWPARQAVAPSARDNIPLWLTILCGIGGVIIGWYLYNLVWRQRRPGIDWVRWLIAIAVAAASGVLADMVMMRSRTRRTQV